jgi:hypothetical protein
LKRILLTGAAVAGLFTAGITTAATAAGPKPASSTIQKKLTTTKTVTASATCKVNLTTAAPLGSIDVTAGGSSGIQFGKQFCGTPLGAGISHATFTLSDSGDLSGSIQHWFPSGQVFGTYTLTPGASSGPPTATSFGQASYDGTVTIKGGTGALKGATGSGTMTCSTNDAVHYTCTEKLKLAQTVQVAAPSM